MTRGDNGNIKQIHPWRSKFFLLEHALSRASQLVDLDVATYYLTSGQPSLVVADGLFNSWCSSWSRWSSRDFLNDLFHC